MKDAAGRGAAASERSQLIGIELLRFISAFAVLIWHYQHFAFTSEGIVIERSKQPFYGLLAPLYNHGARGVHVFWCISGLIFFYKYFQGLAAGTVSFREFGLNRFSRLYPLHFLTLLLVAALQWAYVSSHGYFFVFPFNDVKHFILNLFFISGWGFETGYSFNGPIWSVSIELIVYVVFFVLVSRLPLGWAYIAATALSVALGIFGRGQIAQGLMYFFIGGAIALCRFFPDSIALPAAIRKRSFVLLGGLIALACVAFTALYVLHVQPPVTMRLLRTAVVTALVYAFVAANSFLSPFSRLWAFLGNLTYASYLMHFPIQLGMVMLLPLAGFAIQYTNPVLLITFLAIVIGVAALVYRTVEMPLQRAIRRRYA